MRPESRRVYAALNRAQEGLSEAAREVAYAGPMRTLRLVIGALVAVAGGVWLLQGIGVLPGSFMSGDPTWAWIGGGTLAIGLGLLAWTSLDGRR